MVGGMIVQIKQAAPRAPARRWVSVIRLGLLGSLLVGCGPAGGEPRASDAAAGAAGPAAATARPVERIKIAIGAPGGVFAPHYLARAVGYFAEEGLEVEVPSMQATLAIAGLTSGEIDYNGFFSLTINAALQGMPQRVIGTAVARSTRRFMVPAQIRSMEQLRGGSIAVSVIGGGPYGSGILALEAFGIDPHSEVTWLQVGGSLERLVALQQGAAQAAILSGPEVPQAEAMGFTTLLRLDEVAPLPESGVSTTTTKLETQPDQVRRVLRAVVRALRYLKTDRDGSVTVLMQFLNLERPEAEQAYDGVAWAYSDDGTISERSLRYTIDEDARVRGIGGDVPASRVTDFAPLYAVLGEMGITPAADSAR
jgi:NitT/TauT family transport system substrate-binding protein